ncbi:MAG: IS110 family transposase, partial [Solirubrobacteraceae bacterium]
MDAVVGGDTHKDTHALELVAGSGAAIATITVGNDAGGYAAAIGWIAGHAAGRRLIVGLEGTRSYGIGLARALQRAGLTVVEVERPKREQRRGRGKSDAIDARLAALAVLRMDADRLPTPRADGDREALRILLSARAELVGTQTGQLNRLRALLLLGDDTERALSHGRVNRGWLAQITGRRGRGSDTREAVVRRAESHRLAGAIRAGERELKANRDQLADIVEDLAPGVLTRRGIGPVSAAQALVSWSHPGRCRTEAAFAALAGASPIPASSGRQIRHRLNRGGDRQLNRALHTITLSRWRSCPRTRDYINRRRAEGKTDREIRRILKRYIARELFRTLTAATT